jgi:UDP-N-acetylmuramyl tripeptide synthase
METVSIILGKTVSKLSRLRGNSGSALPGLVIEKTNPKFIKKVLSKLPYGVVVISGTNGKTTTTKVVTEALHERHRQ